jgi:glycosyltransferase domain-containing protein
LGYYHVYERDLPVLIADASSDENKKLNQVTVTSFQDAPFTYLNEYYPLGNPYNRISDALNHVGTEYCVLCADDDFITPGGIQESTDFLDLNPDFIQAYGHYATFYLKFISGREPQFVAQYHNQSNIHVGAKDRLINEITNNDGISLLAVRHIDFMKMIFAETANYTMDLPDGAFRTTSATLFSEWLVVWLSAINGKIKRLDTLYCVREGCTPAHLRRPYNTVAMLLQEKGYKETKQKFCDCIAYHLSKHSGVSLLESYAIVDKMITTYLEKSLYPKIVRELAESDLRRLAYSIVDRKLAKLNVPNWLAYNIIELGRATFFPIKSINTMTSKYYDDYNKIRLQVLSNARDVYGLIPGRNC